MVGQCGSLEGVPVALLPPQEGSPPWVEGSHIGALVHPWCWATQPRDVATPQEQWVQVEGGQSVG